MRVALCLSGLCRDIDRTFGPTKLAFIDPYHTDVFCSFWRDDYSGQRESEAERGIEMYEPRKHLLLPQKDLLTEFKNVYGKAVQDTTGSRNCLNMFYQIFRCNELKRMAEKEDGHKYDVVIRARADVDWQYGRLRQDPDTIHIRNNKPMTPMLGDWFAYGPSHLMDIYSSAYLYLPKIAQLNDEKITLPTVEQTTYNNYKQSYTRRLQRLKNQGRYKTLSPHGVLATNLGMNQEKTSFKVRILPWDEIGGTRVI